MASFFSSVRSFGRQSNKGTNSLKISSLSTPSTKTNQPSSNNPPFLPPVTIAPTISGFLSSDDEAVFQESSAPFSTVSAKTIPSTEPGMSAQPALSTSVDSSGLSILSVQCAPPKPPGSSVPQTPSAVSGSLNSQPLKTPHNHHTLQTISTKSSPAEPSSSPLMRPSRSKPVQESSANSRSSTPSTSSGSTASASAPADPTTPPPAKNVPYFFRKQYAAIMVKGNFMTLATKPELVEKGEWLAHLVVEQYRLLDSMIQLLKLPDERTNKPMCNDESCPTMCASEPIRIPAHRYMDLVQRWMIGKITDSSLFPIDTGSSPPTSEDYESDGTCASAEPIPAGPTKLDEPLSTLSGRDWLGKSSGFPESFEVNIKAMYRQMMRCYAHLYHGHWIAFWHLSVWKELNTCFTHFLNVGNIYKFLLEKDLEPMRPLMNIWTARKLLPSDETSQQT